MRSIWLAILLVAATAGKGNSQVCFRGRPQPACRRFVVAETGYLHKIVGTAPDIWHKITLEFGRMWNQGPENALGGSALIGIGDYDGYYGARFRYRRWLTRSLSLEVGIGPALFEIPTNGGASPYFRSVGLTSSLSFSVADLAGVEVRLDVPRSQVAGDDPTLYVGGKLESYTAVLATLGLLIFGLARLPPI